VVQDEGHIQTEHGRVWFRRLTPDGEAGGRTPLLLLHGGPGAASYYLESFAERAATGRPVVLFDQLGAGRSDKPDDPALWTMDRAVAELDLVRAALGLERCHLLGQSWGGWLAIEYLAGRGREGIVGLILASTSASIREFTDAAAVLIDALPEPARTTIQELGAQGAYDDPAYLEAVDVFYAHHLCRLDPLPPLVQATMRELESSQVYLTMNGPTEFDVTGPLREWDRTADLGRIACPTLVTVGGHDEITPSCAATLQAGIPGARMELFEDSGHMAHEEEPERYATVVAEFLAEADAATPLISEES
jgi:proline iminopeptidase